MTVPFRIAHVTASRVRGGLSRVVESLVRSQSRSAQVLLVAPVMPPEWVLSGSASWQHLDVEGNSHVLGHLALMRRLSAFRPDVVFLHAGSPGELALATALVSTYRTVVVEHAPDYYPLFTPTRDRLFAICKRRASVMATVSHAGAHALEHRWNLAPGVIQVVHNGVDAPPDEPPGDVDGTRLFAGHRVVLGAGVPDSRKGFDTFCAVAEALAPSFGDVGWVWVGGDRRLVAGRVEVLRWSDALGWMLQRASLVLLPSRAEGLPLFLLEAWACARPVVASRVGGIPEVLAHEGNGMLVDPEDLRVWISTVDLLLRDAFASSTLGRTGHESWKTTFTAQAMADRWQRVIEAVLAK